MRGISIRTMQKDLKKLKGAHTIQEKKPIIVPKVTPIKPAPVKAPVVDNIPAKLNAQQGIQIEKPSALEPKMIPPQPPVEEKPLEKAVVMPIQFPQKQELKMVPKIKKQSYLEEIPSDAKPAPVKSSGETIETVNKPTEQRKKFMEDVEKWVQSSADKN